MSDAALVTNVPVQRLTSPWDRRRVALTAVALGFVVSTTFAANAIGLDPIGLIDGISHIIDFLGRCLPPAFPHLARHIDLAFDTLLLAVVGTVLATLLSIPIAFLAAANTTPHRYVSLAMRGIIVFCRSVPDLVFALIFAAALRYIGPVPGALALSAHSIGMVAKLFSDAIEEADDGPREAMLSNGSSRIRSIVASVVPQVLPSFASTVLYRLEINVRTSVVLGFVGGGGIGFALQTELGSLDYRAASGIVVIILVMIVAIERLSSYARHTLIGDSPKERRARRAVAPWADHTRISAPWTAPRVQKTLGVLAVVAFAVYCLFDVGIGPGTLWHAAGRSFDMIGRVLPPDWSITKEVFDLMVETVRIGLVGTALGLVFAIPLGLLAARNVAPARWVSALARYLMVGIRGLPDLVVALIFVTAIGLSAYAGALALALITVGFGGKLIADNIEQVDPGPSEAVTSTGSSRMQRTAAATVVQAAPSLVGTSLYLFDVNVRASTILGIVGAGGIGFDLSQTIRTLHFHETGMFLLQIFVVVLAIELLSAKIRKLLI